MQFGAGYMFMLLWLIPVVIVFFVFSERRRRKVINRFATKKILTVIAGSFDRGKRKLKNGIIIVAIFFVVIALLRPQWGFQWREVKRRGIDILIALDTSKSMLAQDVLPNRLDRAKLAIKDLVKKLNGDRIGLVAFSGTAFLQCPLTADYDGFLLSLEDVDVNTLPIGGTSLAKAIYTAIDSYEGGKKQDKILIIITDGEDLEGGINQAIKRAKEERIEICCVGIGSVEGEIIQIVDRTGKMGFLKDANGEIVRTKLEEGTLQKVALETGGMYVRATGAEFGLTLIYDEKLSKLEKQEFKSRMRKRYNERFQFPLGVAIFLLMVEPLLGDRRSRKKRKKKDKQKM